MEFDEGDRLFVEQAVQRLESPNFLIRVADLVGRPVEGLIERLPERVRDAVGAAVQGSLVRGLDWVVRDEPREPGESEVLANLDEAGRAARKRGRQHTLIAAATGAAGGLFGTASLALELPVTTLVMLRSIARVAEEMGANPADPAVRLSCLSVFSLGGSSAADDAVDSAYLATRVGLNHAIQEAARYLATHSTQRLASHAGKQLAPAVSRFLVPIASRFQIAVSEKVAAQAIPVLGALGGATVNIAFTNHFNTVALYHFGLQHLEREHGAEAVEALYREILARKARPGGASSVPGEG